MGTPLSKGDDVRTVSWIDLYEWVQKKLESVSALKIGSENASISILSTFSHSEEILDGASEQWTELGQIFNRNEEYVYMRNVTSEIRSGYFWSKDAIK